LKDHLAGIYHFYRYTLFDIWPFKEQVLKIKVC